MDANTVTYTNPNGDAITGIVTGTDGDYLVVIVQDDKNNDVEVLVSK